MQEHEDEHKTNTDIRNVTAPILTILSVIGFFMWITYVGTNERAEIRGRLSVIENTLVEVKEKLKFIHIGGVNDTLSKNDLAIFCLKLQLANKDWKCPIASDSGRFQLNQLNDHDILREIDRLNKETETLKQ